MSILTRRLSIRWIAPLTIGGLVVLVAGILGFLAWVQGRNSAEEMIAHSFEEVRARIGGQLDQLIGLPPRINKINKQLLDSGALDTDKPRTWRKTMFEICTAFPHLSCICWGDETGRATWIARYPGAPKYDYAIKDDKTGDRIFEYYYNEDGSIEEKSKGDYEYDPRVRPWYFTCLNAEGPVWSEPFGWVREDGSEVALGISYAQPYYRDDKLVGVIDSELTLLGLGDFLATVPPSAAGLSFITDLAGGLVATSESIPVADEKMRALPALEASDPRIVAAARIVGSFNRVSTAKRYEFEYLGEPYLLEVAPFRHPTGLKWVMASVVPEADFLGPVMEANARILAIGMFACGLSTLAGVILALRLARPIQQLQRHVERIGAGDFKTRIDLNQTSEFVDLTASMNAMSEDLADRMRLRESLALAMEVQQSLLPHDDPDAFGLDVAGHSTYCDETGGDYYDFLHIDGTADHTLSVAVGDVMGHGIAAAMLMATARGILHSRTKTPGRLCELLTHMNTILVRDTDGERFMTMLLLTIDADLRRMRWASAGHGAPILYDPSTDKFPALGRGGLPLGLMAGVAYQERVVEKLKPGTILLPCTDGVWETRNENGEEWGLDRFHQLIRDSANESAAEISSRIRTAVEGWRGNSAQDDDITFVVVKLLDESL
ncbi:MAG: SpoIIE family protein phosphatase [Planctomycetota bacterium]|jgi:sigma-B regulation protein RsbU (phosphoserine phosphatase)